MVAVRHATLTDEPNDPGKDVSADAWNEGHTIDWAESGDISMSTPSDVAAAGSSGEIPDAGHVHPRDEDAIAAAGLIYAATNFR